MELLNVAARQMFVGPDEIFSYFGIPQPASPNVELWSMEQILDDYNRNPTAWAVEIAAKNDIPKHLETFAPAVHVKWSFNPQTGRGTNGMHGAVTHAAEVRLNPDGTKIFMYDKYHRTNGKPSGKFINGIEEGTVGAHTAPIIYDVKTGRYLVGFFMQYRPDMIWKDKIGAWSASLPGGYGLGDPKALALEELKDEFGLQVVQDYVKLGYSNPDKAQWGDSDMLGLAMFRIEDINAVVEQPDHEIILKSQYLVDIRMFPFQLDQYDTLTIAMAREFLYTQNHGFNK